MITFIVIIIIIFFIYIIFIIIFIVIIFIIIIIDIICRIIINVINRVSQESPEAVINVHHGQAGVLVEETLVSAMLQGVVEDVASVVCGGWVGGVGEWVGG